MKQSIVITLVIILSSSIFVQKEKWIRWNEKVKYKVSNRSNNSFETNPFSHTISYRMEGAETVVFDSYCNVNQDKICQYTKYTEKKDFVKCLNIMGKYTELCCRRVKKEIKEENLYIDSSNVYTVFTMKTEQLTNYINDEYYCTQNVIRVNMDSLDLALDMQLRTTEKYKTEVRIPVQ